MKLHPLMAYEVTRDLTVEDVVVETPVATTTKKHLLVETCDCANFACWFGNG